MSDFFLAFVPLADWVTQAKGSAGLESGEPNAPALW